MEQTNASDFINTPKYKSKTHIVMVINELLIQAFQQENPKIHYCIWVVDISYPPQCRMRPA